MAFVGMGAFDPRMSTPDPNQSMGLADPNASPLAPIHTDPIFDENTPGHLLYLAEQMAASKKKEDGLGKVFDGAMQGLTPTDLATADAQRRYDALASEQDALVNSGSTIPTPTTPQAPNSTQLLLSTLAAFASPKNAFDIGATPFNYQTNEAGKQDALNIQQFKVDEANKAAKIRHGEQKLQDAQQFIQEANTNRRFGIQQQNVVDQKNLDRAFKQEQDQNKQKENARDNMSTDLQKLSGAKNYIAFSELVHKLNTGAKTLADMGVEPGWTPITDEAQIRSEYDSQTGDRKIKAMDSYHSELHQFLSERSVVTKGDVAAWDAKRKRIASDFNIDPNEIPRIHEGMTLEGQKMAETSARHKELEDHWKADFAQRKLDHADMMAVHYANLGIAREHLKISQDADARAAVNQQVDKVNKEADTHINGLDAKLNGLKARQRNLKAEGDDADANAKAKVQSDIDAAQAEKDQWNALKQKHDKTPVTEKINTLLSGLGLKGAPDNTPFTPKNFPSKILTGKKPKGAKDVGGGAWIK